MDARVLTCVDATVWVAGASSLSRNNSLLLLLRALVC